MPREITDKEAILSGLKSLELTSELFTEVNGKLKNANDLEVIVEGKVNASADKRHWNPSLMAVVPAAKKLGSIHATGYS